MTAVPPNPDGLKLAVPSPLSTILLPVQLPKLSVGVPVSVILLLSHNGPYEPASIFGLSKEKQALSKLEWFPILTLNL